MSGSEHNKGIKESKERKIDVLNENEEDEKEMTLSKDDKIEAFNLLTWSSLAALFLSIWQIVIPFVLFKLNFSQLCLGFTSIFFLILSFVVVIWSNKNFKYLKEHEKETNPILHTWHIEGMIYVISYILVACYATFLVGIIMEQGYSWSLLVAQGNNPDEAFTQSIVLMVVQCVLIIGDFLILSVYIRYSYHLEFLPKHLPSILGYFLSIYIVTSCIVLGDQDYLRSYIGRESSDFIKLAESSHTKIFWITVVTIFLCIFFIIEGRSTQMQLIPKVRFFFFPTLFLFSVGGYVVFNQFSFLMAASDINLNLNQSCKATVQAYGQDFVQQIGCPMKYFTYSNNHYYNQNCPTQNSGLVWENDLSKLNSAKQNQIACLNLNCCYLITEQRSLKYKEFFLITLLSSLIGFISGGHCLDLAFQAPRFIKAGPSTYSSMKFAAQLVLAILAILVSGFIALQYQPQIPTNNIPHILKTLASLPQCALVSTLTQTPLQVRFSPNSCASSIKSNLTICNKNVQGFAVCLKGQFGVFQLDPKWDGTNARVNGVTEFDVYALQQALHGLKTSDTFCVDGQQDAINTLISSYLFFCKNPGKTPIITLTQQQMPLPFLAPSSARLLHEYQGQSSIDSDRKQKHLEWYETQQDLKVPVKNQQHKLAHDSGSSALASLLSSSLSTSQSSRLRSSTSSQSSRSTSSSPSSSRTSSSQTSSSSSSSSPSASTSSNWYPFVSQDKYGVIKLNIFNAEESGPINGATISLVENAASCSLLDQAVYSFLRQVTSDSTGSAVINNIQVFPNAQLMVQVRADGYYYNCFSLGILKADQVLTKSLPLVPFMKSTDILRALLFYQSQDLDIELGATYNLDTLNECQVGYIQEQCGGLEFKVSYQNKILRIQNPAQVITINKMTNFNYLFFVKLVPKETGLKNALNNNIALSNAQQTALTKLNDQFLKEDIFINVYVQNRLFPAAVYKPTKITHVVNNDDSTLVWLAFCIDGRVGPTSQEKFDEYWTKGTEYWQRSGSVSPNFPNAQICDKFFAEEQAQGRVPSGL